MRRYIKEKIEQGILIVIAFIIAYILLYAMSVELKKAEINECNNWAKMAEEHKDFYLTKNQAEQCKFLNIDVNAIVK